MNGPLTLQRAVRPGGGVDAGRRIVAGARLFSISNLHQARKGFEAVRCRRERAHRLLPGLRSADPGSRSSLRRQGGPGAGRGRNAVRSAGREGDPAGRNGEAALPGDGDDALRKLWDRGHHACRTPSARCHRPEEDRQDGGRLPRRPRQRSGQGRFRGYDAFVAGLGGSAGRDGREHPDAGVQRHRGGRETAVRSPRRDRGGPGGTGHGQHRAGAA